MTRRSVPNVRFGKHSWGSVRFGRLGKPTIDTASIPKLFQEYSPGARLYPKSVQQRPSGVAKRVVKIQSILHYDQPFLRYSLFYGPHEIMLSLLIVFDCKS